MKVEKTQEAKSVKRLFWTLISFSLMLIFLLAIIEKIYFDKNIHKAATFGALHKVKQLKLALDDYIIQMQNTTKILRNLDAFKQFLKEKKQNDKLQSSLMHLMQSNLHVMEIKYIDKYGLERMKISKDNEHKISFAKQENLDDKTNRYYFLNSKLKPLENVWVTQIDLQKAKNKILSPYRPTIRAVLPISNNDKFDGILVVNFYIEYFLEKLTDSFIYDMIIFDDNGYIITHYKSYKNWGFYKKNKFNIAEDFPKIYKNMLSNTFLQTDDLIYAKLNNEIKNGINIVLSLKPSYIQSQSQSAIKQYFITFVVTFMLSLIVAVFIVKIFSKTILNLEKIRNLNNKLKKLKLKSEIALKNTSVGIWELNLKTNILRFDPQIYHIYGLEKYQKEEPFVIWKETIDKQVQSELDEKLQFAINNNEEYNATYWITTYKGERKFIKTFGLNELDENGIAIKMIGTNQDITSQIQNEMLLRKRTNEQNTLLSLFSKSDSVLFKWENKPNYPVHYISDNVDKVFGYTKQEWFANKILYQECMYIKDVDEFNKEIQEGIKNKASFIKHKPYRIICKNGSIKWLHDQTVFELDKNGEILYLIGYVTDITKSKEHEISLKKSNNKLQAIFDTSLEGICILNLDTTHLEVNKQYTKLLGYDEEELSVLKCSDFTSKQYIQDNSEVFLEVLKNGYYENFERDCITKDKQIKRIRSSITLMPNQKQFLMTTVDITDIHNALKLIEKQSFTDELTKLGNRKAYNEKIHELISQYSRYDIIFSMIMLDIDYFKSINDTYGHNAGDYILMKLGIILSSCIRKNDFAFRIGGEEFVVLLPSTSCDNANIFAEKLRQKVQEELSNIKNKVVTISIGVTEIEKTDSVDSIFIRADKYLYHAKFTGRNKVVSVI